ncbi:MAG: hypothetical protein AAB893_03775 [Patescibacteria group bacterium]
MCGNPVGEGAIRVRTILLIVSKIGYTITTMTLTEFSYQARVALKFGLIFGALFGGFVILFVVLLMSIKPVPRKISNIKTVFGKLESPIFEEAQDKKKLSFFLDTVDGELPIATSEAAIYFIPQKQTTLAYLNKIYAVARGFGFDTDTIKHEPINETWVKFEDESRLLSIDIRTFHYNFHLKGSDVLQNLIEATPEGKFTSRETEILDKAKETIRLHEGYTEDLASGKTNIVYVKYDVTNQTFYPVSSEETPQAVRIDFFRKDEGTTPVVSPRFYESHNYVVLAPLTQDVRMIAEQYKSFDKLITQQGVYPIKPIQTVWEEIKANKASIIALENGYLGKIKVKQIYVAYYDPEEYQKYFQPIFVVIGDHGYIGYISAIVDSLMIN